MTCLLMYYVPSTERAFSTGFAPDARELVKFAFGAKVEEFDQSVLDEADENGTLFYTHHGENDTLLTYNSTLKKLKGELNDRIKSTNS